MIFCDGRFTALKSRRTGYGDVTMTYYIVAAFAAVAVALIGLIQGLSVAKINKSFAKSEKARQEQAEKVEKRADAREEEGLLSMRLLNSSVDLSMATALAVKGLSGVSVNGNLDRAIQTAQLNKNKYDEYIDKIASKEVLKNRRY